MRFDFKCAACGRVFEGQAAMRDTDAVLPCPDCQNQGKRIFSPRGQVVAIPRRFLNGVTKADVME